MAKKKKKKKRLRVKNVFVFVLIIAILVGVVCLLSLLKVKTYYIYNNKYLSDKEVLDELKLSKKSSYLFTNTFAEKAIIRKSKLIKDVKLKKTISLEIKVDVTEYKILFVNNENNKSVLENGKEIDYVYDNAAILLNKVEDEEIYKKFIKKMCKVDDDILGSISEISYTPNGIDKERFLFSMNDGNYVYVTISKLTKINEYKEIIGSVENRKGILYLDYGNYFVPKE